MKKSLYIGGTNSSNCHSDSLQNKHLFKSYCEFSLFSFSVKVFMIDVMPVQIVVNNSYSID